MFISTTAGRLLLAAAIFNLAKAADYRLVDSFDQSNFFGKFEFFSGPDPTKGFVKYVDIFTADRTGLAGYVRDGVYLGVDFENHTTTGRPSVRVISKKSYTKGLFIADIAHMPAGVTDEGSCGLWPALWTVTKGDWPAGGEIDLIEGVNTQSNNSIVLHTATQCHVANTGTLKSTKVSTTDCKGDVGCRQEAGVPSTYGAGFNAQGGGLYALEWTDKQISTWFFPRGSDIANILTTGQAAINITGLPGTESFGPPLARFIATDGCSFADSFRDHRIVINTAFCGQWAGEVWDQDATCKSLARTCEDHVGRNPEAFREAYWLINSIKVYQKGGWARRSMRRGVRYVS